MPGITAALGRAITNQSMDDARMAREARSAPPPRGNVRVPSGGDWVSRMANIPFAISGWNDIFNRWLPSLELHTKVVAQGNKTTPNKAVLHTALSIAFGLMRTRRLANLALRVNLDHTLNRADVAFGVSTNAILDLTNVLGTLVDTATDANTIIRGVKDPFGTWFGVNPGTFKRGEAATPPAGGPETRKAPGDTPMGLLQKIWETINKNIGSGSVWTMPAEVVVGGQPPWIMDGRDELPFNDMLNATQLDRGPNVNPQPPAASGFDLRTLVAQVLHDPGVRPPLPRTDQGPPVVANELTGV